MCKCYHLAAASHLVSRVVSDVTAGYQDAAACLRVPCGPVRTGTNTGSAYQTNAGRCLDKPACWASPARRVKLLHSLLAAGCKGALQPRRCIIKHQQTVTARVTAWPCHDEGPIVAERQHVDKGMGRHVHVCTQTRSPDLGSRIHNFCTRVPACSCSWWQAATPKTTCLIRYAQPHCAWQRTHPSTPWNGAQQTRCCCHTISTARPPTAGKVSSVCPSHVQNAWLMDTWCHWCLAGVKCLDQPQTCLRLTAHHPAPALPACTACQTGLNSSTNDRSQPQDTQTSATL